MLKFRDILKEQQEVKKQTELFSTWCSTEAKADKFLDLLSKKNEVYAGSQHCKNIETYLDQAVPDYLKLKFTPSEIFLLLSSIRLHDIGKIYVDEHNSKKDNTLQQKGAGKHPGKSKKNKNSEPSEADEHSRKSCLKILSVWPQLDVPEDMVQWLAVLVCSHTWQTPVPPARCKDKRKCKLCGKRTNGQKCSHLDCQNYYRGDIVRLKWLAALLRLGDEVDNCKERAIPSWVAKEDEEQSWRRLIDSVIFDSSGGCIKLKTLSIDHWFKEDKKQAEKALYKIDGVLEGWRKPLIEMGLNFSQSFLDVSFPIPVLYKKSDLKKKKYLRNNEPRLNGQDLILVKESMSRLDNAVILKDGLFSWEDLAEESRLGDIGKVKLAVERLGSEQLAKKLSGLRPIVSSGLGWTLEKKNKRNEPLKNLHFVNRKKVPHIIRTGIVELDNLLCPPNERNRLGLSKYGGGGFYAPVIESQEDNHRRSEHAESKKSKYKWLAPIVVIEGSSAEGKTTLSLQIGCNLVGRNEGWTCVYYSLEHNPESIQKLLDGHDYFLSREQTGNKNELPIDRAASEALRRREQAEYDKKKEDIKDKIVNLEKEPWYLLSELDNKLLLARLSPRHAGKTGKSADEVFERRYSELRQSLEWARHFKKKLFYFIDSITAFSNEPLSRIQVHRLLSLFETMETPAIITLEKHRDKTSNVKELPYYDHTRYIADIVVRLEHEDIKNYYRQTIEVAKTRYNRHILGKHLMKIKSPGLEATKNYDNRHGIVVYHSIHNQIVQSRTDEIRGKNMWLDISSDDLPVGEVKINKKRKKQQKIKSGTCIAISGPFGGHKFALGVNLMLGATTTSSSDKQKRKLIVSFAEEREVNLREVALLKEMSRWRKKLKPMGSSDQKPDKQTKMKVWEQHFGDGGTKEFVTLLNFRPGDIMPEEFLYIFRKYLEKNKKDIDTLLFSDTAQLRTRFPLLYDEPLFLPTVVDVIKSKGLFSIFIDVMDDDKPNTALMAAADCRIYIEKKGNIEKKKNIEKNENIEKKENGDDNDDNLELINYIRSENVRGKGYDQDRRKISVERKNRHYVLEIKKTKNKPDKNKADQTKKSKKT